jgi:hypothetical protein
LSASFTSYMIAMSVEITCHTGSFCNVLNLGLGAVCAVSAGKVKVAGPAKDDFADAAVSHRTDVSSGPRSDRPRSGSWCARLIKRVRRDSDWSASAYKYDGGHCSSSLLLVSFALLVTCSCSLVSALFGALGLLVLLLVWQLDLLVSCNKVI